MKKNRIIVNNKEVVFASKILSEFLGSILLVFLLTLPFSINLFTPGYWDNDILNTIARIFEPFISKTLFIGFSIYISIKIFSWGGANLNPINSIVSMFNRETNIPQGTTIILFQFIGGFVASILVYFTADSIIVFDSNSTLGAIDISLQYYDWKNLNDGESLIYNNIQIANESWYLAVVFFAEMFLTFGFLFFSYSFKKTFKKNRLFLVFLGAILMVSLGMRTNNISLNPSRTLSPLLSNLIFGGDKTPLDFLWVFIVPQFLAGISFGVFSRINLSIKIKETQVDNIRYTYSQLCRKLILVSESIPEINRNLNLSNETFTTIKELSRRFNLPKSLFSNRDLLESRLSFAIFKNNIYENNRKLDFLKIPNFLIEKNIESLNSDQRIKRKLFDEIFEVEYLKKYSQKTRNNLWRFQ